MIALPVILILAPVLIFSVNATLNRMGKTDPHRTPFVSGYYVAAIWTPIYIAFCIYIFGFSIIEILSDIVFGIIYIGCVIFLNWFIFTLTDVSMHIQILFQISNNKKIRLNELLARYNKDTILLNRIPRLIELKQLKLEHGRLFLVGHTVLIGASFCTLLRAVLGIPLKPEDAKHS